MRHGIGMLIAGAAALLLNNNVACAENPPADSIPPELRAHADQAIRRGLDWLAANQKEDGSWSNSKNPALTALPMWAFAQSTHPKRDTIVARARDFVLTCVQDDGGIYRRSLLTGGLSTYNTAISMTALHALDDPSLAPVILNARTFLAGSQKLTGDEYDGGFGYARSTLFVHADLQNTAAAVEAMRLTAGVEDLRPRENARTDIDWDRAIAFVERLQNKPQTGPEHAGGMTYKPGSAKAGKDAGPDGTVVLRSSGSMTYSGFLSLIYADLPRDDPRVQSAFQWAARHWTVEENPGVGDSGFYFYLRAMSRALKAYGRDRIPQEEGDSVEWKRELVRRVVELEKPGDNNDGYWVNDRSGRFWENDAVLVTAYSILTLQTALGQ